MNSQFLKSIMHDFRCPTCGIGNVAFECASDTIQCQNSDCSQRFPIVNGCPILLCEEKSLFSFCDYTNNNGVTTMDLNPDNAKGLLGRCKEFIKSLLPDKSASIVDYSPEDFIIDLTQKVPNPKVLVVGAGDAGIHTYGNVEITYTDVALGPLTNIIADAHDIPFQNEVFDAIIAVAVLEHVVAPNQVVNEIIRVLKPNGAVYVNTPFMQQVHMGRYDFTRYTHLGHRILFNQFDELKSGVSNGPGMVVAWSIEYFIRSHINSKRLESLICYPLRALTWLFRFTDRFIGQNPGVYDAASAYYFVGFKRSTPIPVRELVESYKGKQQ